MEYSFYVTCYTIGILAASGIGPIFVLTFNRGALHGFLHGFATALGAAIADSIFFFLALFGVLSAIEESAQFMVALDFIGGVLLFYLAYRMYQKALYVKDIAIGRKENLGITLGRSFALTMLNPMTVFFFMLIVVKLIPPGMQELTIFQMLRCSFCVFAGSLTILGTVSFVASGIGHRISHSALQTISYLTSLAFSGFGSYLLFRFVRSFYFSLY